MLNDVRKFFKLNLHFWVITFYISWWFSNLLCKFDSETKLWFKPSVQLNLLLVPCPLRTWTVWLAAALFWPYAAGCSGVYLCIDIMLTCDTVHYYGQISNLLGFSAPIFKDGTVIKLCFTHSMLPFHSL